MKAEESHMSTSPITVFRGGAGTVALALAAAMVLSACSSGEGGEAHHQRQQQGLEGE